MKAKQVKLEKFLPKGELSAIKSFCRGEEGPFFRQMIKDLKKKISEMPQTYETDGQGENAVAHLHYFKGACDWWITERDMEEEQEQAFGFACLGYPDCAELGYIPITELIACGVELDLYYTPETIGEIKKRIGCK